VSKRILFAIGVVFVVVGLCGA